MVRATGPAAHVLGAAVGLHAVLWTVSYQSQVAVEVLMYPSAALKLMMAYALYARMNKRPYEQGLARLAPRAPATAAFNAVLGRALLKQYVLAWAACAAVALVGAHFMLDGHLYMPAMMTMFFLTLPAAALFLRDLSRPIPLVEMLAMALWLLALVVLPQWLADQPAPVQLAAAAAVLAAAAGIIVLALRRMGRAPVLFPAGRRA